MPNDPKCRTRTFPSCRSHWSRLFIPDPNNGTSGSDAYERHGYGDERLHVPPVSTHFSHALSLTETTVVFSVLGSAVGLAVDEAIIATVLPRKLAAIPNFDSLGLGNDMSALNDSIGQVHLIAVRRFAFVRRRLTALNPTRTSPFVMRCYTRGRVRSQRRGWWERGWQGLLLFRCCSCKNTRWTPRRCTVMASRMRGGASERWQRWSSPRHKLM